MYGLLPFSKWLKFVIEGGREKNTVKNTQCVFSVQFLYNFRTYSGHNQYDFRIKKHTKHTKTHCVFCSENILVMFGNCTEIVQKKHTVFFTVFFSYPPLSQISTILK